MQKPNFSPAQALPQPAASLRSTVYRGPATAATIPLMPSQIFARKSLDNLVHEMAGEDRLRRALGPVALTAMGVGAIIDPSIFVLVGEAARHTAGPALMLSSGVACIACVFGALRHAEFASMAAVAVGNHRSMVGTDDGGILPAAVTRYWSAVQRAPDRALAIGACSYVTQRGGRWRRLPDALPRVRFAIGRAAALCDVPIEDLSDEDLRTQANDVAEHTAGASTEDRARREGCYDARTRVVCDQPRRLEARVDAPAEGTLVVADTWFPGWTCEVDGIPAEIRRAHGVFRAVSVAAGRHRVVFEYRPQSFYVGAGASLAGLALTAMLALLARIIHRPTLTRSASEAAQPTYLACASGWCARSLRWNSWGRRIIRARHPGEQKRAGGVAT